MATVFTNGIRINMSDCVNCGCGGETNPCCRYLWNGSVWTYIGGFVCDLAVSCTCGGVYHPMAVPLVGGGCCCCQSPSGPGSFVGEVVETICQPGV